MGWHAERILRQQCTKLVADLSAGTTALRWEDYDAPAEEILRGAGCWQATFPARGSDTAAAG